MQDKRWGTHWVDAELKDDWLERLNALPGIEIQSSCAGHRGIRQNEFPGGPEVILRTIEPQRFVRAFAQVLYGVEPLFGQADSFSKPVIQSVIPKSQFLGIFGPKQHPYIFQIEHLDREKPSIRLMADRHRDEMSDADFNEWWETLLRTLETMSRP